MVKNFQLQFTPKAFELEVGIYYASDFILFCLACLQTQMWGPVIQLNLVRSVNFLIAFIADQGLYNTALLSPRIRTLCFRLAPLRKVEEDLVKILSRRASLAMQKLNSPFRLLENVVGNGSFRSEESTVSPTDSDFNEREYGPIRRVLDALGEDIAALWQDESLQEGLKSVDIALEEEPGLWVNVQSLNLIPELQIIWYSFLDHAVRVTRGGYKPRLGMCLRPLPQKKLSADPAQTMYWELEWPPLGL